MSLLLFLLLGLLPATSAEHRVVQISSPGFLRPVEPSIAINPTDPDDIVAAAIRYGTPQETRVVSMRYRSKDGGRTWDVRAEASPDSRPQGDDAVAFSHNGIAYHSYISFRGLRTKKSKRNGIYVSRSAEKGDAWNPQVVVVDHLNSMRPYEDKPYLNTDTAADSPNRGNVYIAWTRFDAYQSKSPSDSSQIYFSRSTDNGMSFELPFRISDTGGDCADDDYTVEGAVPAAGPNGEIYISWSGPRGLVFDKSSDGGKSFGKDRVLTELVGGWNMDIPGISRCNGFPVTKVDLSRGPYWGSVYINWVDQRYGDPDVFLLASRDGGATWAQPVRVNDDPLFNGKAQFFTWMAVDPADGAINIVFFDRRDTEGTTTALTLARSLDGGRTFVNHPVALEPFVADKKSFFGDYTGIDAYNGRVAAVFPHFISAAETAISVAIFDFLPGTQTTRP